jgi:hypothetical protein
MNRAEGAILILLSSVSSVRSVVNLLIEDADDL